jgi:hypothetical protein
MLVMAFQIIPPDIHPSRLPFVSIFLSATNHSNNFALVLDRNANTRPDVPIIFQKMIEIRTMRFCCDSGLDNRQTNP